jgi:hypothetical protein
MARKRSPEHDFICQRCGCACDEAGTRHLGGGQGMRACKKPPMPKLRSEVEAEARAIVSELRRPR